MIPLSLHHLKPLANLKYILCVFLLLQLIGCEKISEVIGKTERLRFVIVLVDETGSFALSQNNEETHFWEEVIPWVGRIVDRLRPGEGFGLIGIDGHGFDTNDVRIGLETLDEGVLRAIGQKRVLKERVRELTRRRGAPATDIVGALYHAAYFLDRLDQRYQGVIVIFSDMMQTPWETLGGAENLSFPYGTKCYAFYVNATGRTAWDNLVSTWGPILERARVEIYRDDGNIHFYQRGEMEKVFNSIFPQ